MHEFFSLDRELVDRHFAYNHSPAPAKLLIRYLNRLVSGLVCHYSPAGFTAESYIVNVILNGQSQLTLRVADLSYVLDDRVIFIEHSCGLELHLRLKLKS